MITRMEITYRSRVPCNKRPAIFTTGGYTARIDGHEIAFDFEDMTATTEFKDGYLYLHVEQKNFDADVLENIPLAEADTLLRQVKKEDFIEIFYECFADEAETESIQLEPVDITFFDFSSTVTGDPIEVGGVSFKS